MIRRRLQGVGALQLQNDRWILPHAPEHEQFLIKISADLARQHHSGHFSLWQAENDAQQHAIIAKFQHERQQEYAELADQEQQFLQALAQTIQTEQWTFEKLEAHEQYLHKLSVRLRSIQQRDFFPTSNKLTAVDLFNRCDQTVYEFARTVYTYNSAQR